MTKPTKQSHSAEKSPVSLDVIVGLLPLMLGLQILVWMVYLPSALRGNADFRNCYSAGLIVSSGRGHDLYNYELQKKVQDSRISSSTAVLPYVHLPYEALLDVPLSFFPYRIAYLCMLALNFVFLAASYRILRDWLWRLRERWRMLPFLFLLSFPPVCVTLMQGQDSLITLLLFSAALVNLAKKNNLIAGFMVGLAIFKFQLVLPLVCLFLLWRRWKFVLGAAVSAGIALGASVLVSGFAALLRYLKSLHDISTKFVAGGQTLYVMPISRMPNLRGLFFSIFPGQMTVLILTLVVSVFIIALGAWAGRNLSPVSQLAIAAAAAALVGYHVLSHDLCILVVPATTLLDQNQNRGMWSVTLVWVSTTLCFIAHDYLAAVPVIILFAVLLLVVSQESKTSLDKQLISNHELGE